MNILLLGSGAREHAIAKKLKESDSCDFLCVMPGNPGTAEIAENIPGDPKIFSSVGDIIERFKDTNHKIDLVIVGPEDPLVAGIVDYLKELHPTVAVCGPNKEVAELEGSKAYSKKFMQDAGITTAEFVIVTRNTLPLAKDFIGKYKGKVAIKADGLCAGKGVTVHDDEKSAIESLHSMFDGVFGKASETVIVEEKLEGREFSLFALSNGVDYVLLPSAQDYKRLLDGDKGPNTGGMGAISPSLVEAQYSNLMREFEEEIVKKTFTALMNAGNTYRGFLYFGCMLTNNGAYVLEYNCRLGDPETEVILPRMKVDFADLCMRAALGHPLDIPYKIIKTWCVTRVLAAEGYPQFPRKGDEIDNLPDEDDTYFVYHAGTKKKDGKLVTNGGRVLMVTAISNDKQTAIDNTLDGAKEILFQGKQFRIDIGK